MTGRRVSVIMRSKNADWVIGQALAALFSQDLSEFELLVVDSGSTDRTLELVAHYPHRLLQVESKDYFPGRVLNRACKEATGDILVFQNSDAVPLGPRVLSRLVAAFDPPDVMGAVTRQVPRPDADPWVQREYAASFPDAPALPEWITLSLPMAAVRRSAWERHPFYDAAWGSEDTEWGVWAKSVGARIVYVPDALVMHSHNYTLRQLYGRKFIEGEADAFIYGGRPSVPLGVGRAVAAAARDVVADLRDGRVGEALRAPVRRLTDQWAYFRGRRHGETRRARGDGDTTVGQKVVLDRHVSNDRARK